MAPDAFAKMLTGWPCMRIVLGDSPLALLATIEGRASGRSGAGGCGPRRVADFGLCAYGDDARVPYPACAGGGMIRLRPGTVGLDEPRASL